MTRYDERTFSPMGFPTKVQLIKRKTSEQWYINFPSAIAQAMGFSRGETVEWIVEDKALLALRRLEAPPEGVFNRAIYADALLNRSFLSLWLWHLQRSPCLQN